ncbi:aromatic ring-hydroxylating dioxygenase subunit alpha [Rhodoplanes sp. Z2-YC6860]|uniref:aromatic ring-hydroxylating dioxygenase subunit alpha n=1 Tax=Rhodoplanes sp. Z2-YC6860 TaxID=674703 RepID=UPI00078E6BCD|nr:aromatic ring-hydroxylating dioxygenase subunit alpha [Rhodoplanes sp. Z2-YC6860]AMN44892.1 vanillate monooxygenase [Rhodoplanes sp. Z2-YC6860]
MFLRNGWYSAIWSHELTDKPVGKTFLNEKVVLFRNDRGEVGALEDCCCHRAAPLSLGEVLGANLACGYHGLKFDVNGKCVEVPGQTDVPSGAKVRSYPVHEKNKVVWIWMGDPDKADTSKVPDMPWLSDPKWATTPGNLYVKSNYQFIIDNLLDLTHVSYVHRKTLAGDPREATTPTKTERLNDGVRVGRWMIDFVPPPLFAKAGNFTGKVDRWQHATWHPPGIVYLDVGCAKTGTGAPEGDRSQGISIWSSHLITPETEHSSHYMFCFARDFSLDDQQMSKLLFDGSKATFMEDVEFLEAVQTNRTGGTLDGLVHVTADAAQLQARRMLNAMIGAEQQA